MIKTKMIEDGFFSYDALENKINNFIKTNNIKVIDIKFAATGKDNRATALIIYEVEE